MTTQKTIKIIFVVLAIAIVVRGLIMDSFSVKGDSMFPAIKDGDYIVINRLAYLFSEPKRGDIIVVRPRDSFSKIIKRVIGLPGDWVVFDGDKIIIKEERSNSGEILQEIYLNGDTTKDNAETFSETVDPYEYYVLGDNRDVSIDSRRLGAVDRWSIKGKVIFTLHF